MATKLILHRVAPGHYNVQVDGEWHVAIVWRERGLWQFKWSGDDYPTSGFETLRACREWLDFHYWDLDHAER